MPSNKNKKKAEAESKKSMQKKKEKMLEDKTFGLKNKNKSKKVQQYVQSTKNSIMNGGDRNARKVAEEQKKKKQLAKALKKQKDDERNALFGEALLAVSKKNKNTDQKSGKVEAAGRDANDESNKKSGTSKAMKMMYQMDAKEMEDKLKEDPNYVPTIEDEIEMLRQKKLKELKESGKKGTPVTEQSFKEWQERKRKRKAAEAKKLVDAELKKKKGGKGLSVLSGKDLFEYKRDLFKDDDLDNNDDNNNIGSTTSAEAANSTSNKNDKVVVTDDETNDDGVDNVANKVQSDLFLNDDEISDDDLDDITDD